jgi:hypothetical protein
MKPKNRWIVGLLILSVLQFWACQKNDEAHHFEHPSELVEIEGSEFVRVIFTERAMERIGVETETVIELSNSPLKKVVPYGALIYGPEGETWVYTCPQPRSFVRMVVDVDRIEGDNVFLNDGPPLGTIVATVGVAEIYGTEFEIGH